MKRILKTGKPLFFKQKVDLSIEDLSSFDTALKKTDEYYNQTLALILEELEIVYEHSP